MTKREFCRRCIRLALVLGGAALLVWAFTHGLPYFCPLRWTAGIECPTCGMTRAANALLHFHFLQAWRYHPLIFVVLLYAGILAVLWLLGKDKMMRAKGLWIPLMILFVIWWIVRAVAYVNGQYPAFYEPRAVIPRVFHFIRQFF
ncbi:DUF2752 domain-containing protein [Marasmitruncus massiliensis]|uniref:DUF2752 domain-containing protein n=1 Tax=Marasmitruncus massiliensis TaxID=1944642 RepID=UPI0015E11AA7|nr:DUF2752 domain-containing protein [Marasmitruncus massiliensis]